jgi:outer membrane protein TolC
MAIIAGSSVFAQNTVDEALISVEQNNTTLKALKEDIEAQKLENKTGIYLANPEAEFNYLWGQPNNIGNRNDISVRQTFDFATVTGVKRKISDKRNDLLELQYKSERINILLQAKLYCMDLIYYNALNQELELRLEHARTLVEVYKSRLETGDANILELNKVQLNMAMVQGEISSIIVERNTGLAELKRLNGGIALQIDDFEYPETILSSNFDEWFAEAEQKNPVLEYVRQEVEIAQNQVSLTKAMSLPSISAGYMREKVVGEAYQGISLGISIPLWENKNRLKQAKAAVKANEAKQADSKLQFYEYLKNLYERAKGLKMISEGYKQSLSSLNNTDLLKKALDAGEISLPEYVTEIGLYYNMVNHRLEAEREFQKAFAELRAMELGIKN